MRGPRTPQKIGNKDKNRRQKENKTVGGNCKGTQRSVSRSYLAMHEEAVWARDTDYDECWRKQPRRRRPR